jgi:type VI secretion system protein ImpF
MSALHRGRSVPQFLLDRLTDDEPQNTRDPAISSWEQQRELEDALARDVAALLNTRRKDEPFNPTLEHAFNSVLMYGIPDFTAYNLTNGAEQEVVRRSIERALRLFEPRMNRISVTLEDPDPLRPILRYRVNFVLRAGGESEPGACQIALQRDTRRMAVTPGAP